MSSLAALLRAGMTDRELATIFNKPLAEIELMVERQIRAIWPGLAPADVAAQRKRLALRGKLGNQGSAP